MIEVVDAKLEHLAHLSNNLRQTDIDEIEASSGLSPLEALMVSYHYSNLCWVAIDDQGDPLCIWGVAPHGHPGVGVVWMIGTDDMVQNQNYILRRCPKYIKKIHQLYPTIFNFVDERNYLSQSWLHWMGFSVTNVDLEYGVEKRTFLKFVRQEYV